MRQTAKDKEKTRALNNAVANIRGHSGMVHLVYGYFHSLGDEELQMFVDDATLVSQSSVTGWSTVRAAKWLLPVAVEVQQHRKQALHYAALKQQRDADNFNVGPTPDGQT